MKNDDYLVAWGITKQSNKASQILALLQGEEGAVPANVGSHIRDIYESCVTEVKNVNGTIFEYLLVATLKKLGLTPFGYKATLEKIPSIQWDLVFWDPKTSQPIVLWLTTSVRERYMLADAQGFRLKYDFPGASIFLVSMHQKEVAGFHGHEFESLDGIIYPDSAEFSDLIDRIRKISRTELSNDAIRGSISSGRIIY